MADKKPLPKKLDEDLSNAKYKNKASDVHPKTVNDLFDDSVEKAMYDEILGPMLGRKNGKPTGFSGLDKIPPPLRNNDLLNPSCASSVNSTSNNMEFTTSLLTKLRKVEEEAKENRKIISEQMSLNAKLKQEIIDLSSSIDNSPNILLEMKHLRKENRELHQQIEEMKQFLDDYGLVWVGNDQQFNKSQLEESSDDHSFHFSEKFHHQFANKIKELNDVIHAEPSQIKKEGTNNKKARIVQAAELLDQISLTLYKNGLLINKGPFRPCESDSFKSFIHDIMDGYFPSEFHDQYPDGVIFHFKDKFDSLYEDDENRELMTKTQFLNKLPKRLIKNGEVINMRDDITEKFENNSNCKNDQESQSDNIYNEVLIKSESKNDNIPVNLRKKPIQLLNDASKFLEEMKNNDESTSTKGSIVKIQVKWVNNFTFIVNMFELDTIFDLKCEIFHYFEIHESKKDQVFKISESKEAKYMEDEEKNKENDGLKRFVEEYELRTAYPPKALINRLTMMEAGLVPNGTVFCARKLN